MAFMGVVLLMKGVFSPLLKDMMKGKKACC